MALVGSISGSSGFTALTGSLIPGVGTNELGSSSNKWNTVYANSITGSIQKTGGGQDFIKAGANITANYNSLGQWEITGAAGGGGGAGVFTEASATAAFTTSSIAIGIAAAASTIGSDVFFYVSGSTDGTKNALFGGDVVTSGSLTVRDGTASLTIGDNTFGNSVITANVGHLILDATGINRVIVDKDLELSADNLYAGGSGGLRNLFPDNVIPAHAIVIGGAGSKTVTSGTLQVIGNVISGSTGGNLTLGSSGDVTVVGDLTVSGNDIVFAAAAGNIATAATSLNVGGTSTTTLTLGGAASKVVVAGDLEVQGTTMTVSASNLVIEDPLVGFGFLSGSVATTAGDRGFIGGISGSGNNVAFGWSNSNSAFVATRTTSTPEDTSITISALQPIRASKLEVNGSTAFVTSSGTDLTVSGSTLNLGSNGTVNFYRSGARVAQAFGNTGTDFRLNAMDDAGVTKTLVLSGSGIELGANSQGINLSFVGTTRASISYGANSLQIGTNTGVALALSGTNGLSLTHGAQGTQFIKEVGSPAYMVVEGDGNDARLRATADLILRADGADVKFASGANTPLTFSLAGGNANIQGAAGAQVNIGAVGATGGMTVSGSTVTANVGPGGFVFQRDGVPELFVNAVGSTTTVSGSTDQNVILAAGVAGTGATTIAVSGSTVNSQATIAHRFNLGGTLISHVTSSNGRQGIFPGADSTFDLGGPSVRWAHIYTGDLHLRNERGDYTLIEEPDFLSVRFNKNGKRYKFLLERVPELDETR